MANYTDTVVLVGGFDSKLQQPLKGDISFIRYSARIGKLRPVVNLEFVIAC